MTIVDVFLVAVFIMSLPFIFFIVAALWMMIMSLPVFILGKVSMWREERKRLKNDRDSR